jgi:hypothetical protein
MNCLLLEELFVSESDWVQLHHTVVEWYEVGDIDWFRCGGYVDVV